MTRAASADLVKPAALRPGDKVAVVSSSWGGPAEFPAPFEAGVRVLREVLELEVVEARTARMPAAELARNPRLRAETLNELFADPSVRGIFSTIGGDESVRILPWLDTDLALADPKILMGFSDTTTQLVAYHLAGLVTFNGPSVMAGFSTLPNFPDALRHTRNLLFGGSETGAFETYEHWTEALLDWADPANAGQVRDLQAGTGPRWLHGEHATTGRLFGGAVEVLEFLKGTRWWPAPHTGWWRDRVLFLETTEEVPTVEQVRRWLRNYGAQGVFEDAAALWLGRARDYSPAQKLELEQAVVDVVVGEYGGDLPIVADLDFGHTDPQWVLPLGLRVETDPQARTLRWTESPTR